LPRFSKEVRLLTLARHSRKHLCQCYQNHPRFLCPSLAFFNLVSFFPRKFLAWKKINMKKQELPVFIHPQGQEQEQNDTFEGLNDAGFWYLGSPWKWPKMPNIFHWRPSWNYSTPSKHILASFYSIRCTRAHEARLESWAYGAPLINSKMTLHFNKELKLIKLSNVLKYKCFIKIIKKTFHSRPYIRVIN
jgi:hypothetical protein